MSLKIEKNTAQKKTTGCPLTQLQVHRITFKQLGISSTNLTNIKQPI